MPHMTQCSVPMTVCTHCTRQNKMTPLKPLVTQILYTCILFIFNASWDNCRAVYCHGVQGQGRKRKQLQFINITACRLE